MSDALTGVIRVIHIASAVAWVGGALLWGNVIAPRVMARGPPQIRRPFAEAVIPAMTRYYMIVGPLSILSGLVLIWRLYPTDYFSAFQVGGGYGPALAIGALSAILMAIVGFGVIAPTGKKLLAAMGAASTPPTGEQQAELGALGKRIGMMSMLVILFGTIAMFGMAWAVNAVR
ncbi:MAG TPA: hypothetical protein VM370_07140 [Candidatus Thermoplasmatota archaeon]|nr:hypothetical protein [Candidatus Thermoplasmatota archaeon]